MGKGTYLGGSTVVGFSGTFTSKRSRRLTQATEIDVHSAQKQTRDAARLLAAKPVRVNKKSPIRRTARKSKVERGNLKARSTHKSGGINVAKSISSAEATVRSIKDRIEKSKREMWALERDLHRAKVVLGEAQRLRRISPEDPAEVSEPMAGK